jgi:hypothetical protein
MFFCHARLGLRRQTDNPMQLAGTLLTILIMLRLDRHQVIDTPFVLWIYQNVRAF